MAKKRKHRRVKVSKVVVVEKKIFHNKKLSNKELQELLIENFVGLQKAMTNLSIKFEGLSTQMSQLLQIFELAAKNYMMGESEESKKDVLNKINSLLEQNKVIAGGLIAIEERFRNQPELQEIERMAPTEQDSRMPAPNRQTRPLPRI